MDGFYSEIGRRDGYLCVTATIVRIPGSVVFVMLTLSFQFVTDSIDNWRLNNGMGVYILAPIQVPLTNKLYVKGMLLPARLANIDWSWRE